MALLALSLLPVERGVAAQKSSDNTMLSRAVARSIPAEPDRRHVFVLDSAHLLKASDVAALQDSAQQLQASTGADIAFVTLPTLYGAAVEEAALAIGRAWKVGSAGNPGDPTRNRGLVMLYVPDKKSVAGANLRVEVGRGLEGAITDGGGSRQILEAIKPPFRKKRYGEGFVAAFYVAAELIRAEKPTQSIAPPAPRVTDDSSDMTWPVLVLSALALLVAIAIIAQRRSGPRVMGLTPHDRPRAQKATSGVVHSQMFNQSSSTSSNDDGNRSSGDSGGNSSSDSGSSGDGGSFGDGGGFSGGGSSDSV
jgi:uncharacterized protein